MNSKHISLIVAVALPIFFVLILALVVLVPNMKINPQYDFIYTSSTQEYYDYGTVRYKNTYDVRDGKIMLKLLPSPQIPRDNFSEITYENAPLIYYYDIEEQTSKEITFEEAQSFVLEKGPSSPDGYIVSYENNHEGVFELFGSENKNRYIISKEKGKKTLSGIITDEMYYRADINIIGWVK